MEKRMARTKLHPAIKSVSSTDHRTIEISSVSWRYVGGPARNEVLDGDGFYISYANTAAMGGWSGDGDGIETALVKNGNFKILNGDFRKQYEKLAPEGFDACLRFYEQQSAHADSTWSGH
jgi:hypothetical protein